MGNYRLGRSYPEGSAWRRWDPHIHVPGTLLNNQYGSGEGAWETFFQRIEAAAPAPAALGVTDYFCLDTYVELIERIGDRAPQIELLFPNIELRLDIGLPKGHAINMHLLVSPLDPEHVARARDFLSGLEFSYLDQPYRCDRAGLAKLGKQHKPSILDERKAMEEGATQFKVNFRDLKRRLNGDAWMRRNTLIAVSGSNNDGTAGIQDQQFAALRTEIEGFADIIFASTPKQVEFWLGEGGNNRGYLEQRYRGRKPCLQGSDAHEPDRVLAQERRCWIKGDPLFETLRHACVEPKGRVWLGADAPAVGLPSQIISKVTISNADWMVTPEVPLNPGLVCIIGARGSGKTALADLIAAGAFAAGSQLTERSFIHRAKPALKDEKVELRWLNGTGTSSRVDWAHEDFVELLDSPRVQYLSQQFVETLCSSEGMTDELLREVERVIFHAHAPEDRLSASGFEELLNAKAARARAGRERASETLAAASEKLTALLERIDGRKAQEERIANLKANLDRLKADRTALVTRGGEDRAKALDAVARALEQVGAKVDSQQRRLARLQVLKDEADNLITVKFPGMVQQLRTMAADVGLTQADWDKFKLVFAGDVEGLLRTHIEAAAKAIATLKGTPPAAPADGESYIPAGAELSALTSATLTTELARLQKLVGIDRENQQRFSQLTQRIVGDEATLKKLEEDYELTKAAPEQRDEVRRQRGAAYRDVFAALINEQAELDALYTPLRARLGIEEGALGKLTFDVRRVADLAKWAETGEKLLDLRKGTEFRGRGWLAKAAREELQAAWETGSADEVGQAVEAFVKKYQAAFHEQAPVDTSDPATLRTWRSELARWLYSVEHVKVSYGVQYDGVNLEQLSPGTRGIVLLLLYLSIDTDDLRPLIVDQPEENLDPKSIFEELVTRFCDAKLRRQVIIVTHNANLVVNTDADQVIVATCQPRQKGKLPRMTYRSGGLEDGFIRQQVCEILEGGEAAFRERAKRLGLTLPQAQAA